MRVLVTGGAGFIGSHVVEQALAAGLEVGVLDNFSSGRRENVPAGARVLEVDLRDRAATLRALADFSPELVSHQAAPVSVPASIEDPLTDAQVNIIGGIHLLDACVASGVRHLVFASTGGAIYGEVQEGQRAAEGSTTEPKSPYGIHKQTLERLLAVYREHRGLQSTVLRYANVYGPRQNPHGEAGVVAIYCVRALAGQSLRVFGRRQAGDGGCVRDYVFVSDVARANVATLTGKLREPVLNVGSGQATTTLELAERVRAASGRHVELLQGPPRPGDLERSLLDVTRLQNVLGAPTPLDVGLGQTFDWYRAR